MKVDGKYYALPTAVRSLALFWNKTLFKEAGLDPDRPPATLDELRRLREEADQAQPQWRSVAGRAHDRHGRPGSSLAARSADPPVRRRALLRPTRRPSPTTPPRASTPRSGTSISPPSSKVGQIGFLTDGVTAFRSGKAGMTIDGSFRLGALDGQKGLDYGVAELPSHNGIKSNFASYWVNGITDQGHRAQAGRGGEVPEVHHHARGDGAVDEHGGRAAGAQERRGKGRQQEPRQVRPVHPRPHLFATRPTSSTRAPSARC